MADKLQVDMVVKAITEGFDGLDSDITKIGDAMGQTGVRVEDMSDEFLALNPQLARYKELAQEVKGGTEDLANVVGKSGGADITKGLAGMAKGFIGISTAIAAGRAIKQFIGDSFAAADAAGRLPPIFKEVKTSGEELKEELGVNLGNSMEPAVKKADEFVDSWTESLKLSNELDAAVKRGIITEEKRLEILESTSKFREVEKDELNASTGVLGGVILKTEEERTSFAEARAELAAIEAEEQERITAELEAQRALGGRVTGGRGGLTDEQRRRRGGAAGTGAQAAGMGFFEGIDTGFGGAITQAMQEIDFAQAGGKEFQAQIEDLISAIDTGAIGPELGEDLLAGAFVEWERFQMELGNLSLFEAGKNIQAEFGGTLQEAFDLLREESDLSWITSALEQAVPDDPLGLEKSFDAATGRLEQVRKGLLSLHNTEINLNIVIPNWLEEILGEME